MKLFALRKQGEEAGLQSNGPNMSALVIFGLSAILLLDFLFSPALVNLLEAVAGKFATLEVVLRAHFLVVFFQILLVIFYLLFVNPVTDFRKRTLLYFFMVESLVLCSIWIFDRPDHRFLSENSALTYFSSLFLMICSLTACINLLYLRFQSNRNKNTMFFWYLMTFAFLFASLDEFFMIHEKFSGFIHDVNWFNDLVTGFYAISACIVVGIFYKLLKNNIFTKNGYFFKLMVGSIACLISAVLLDTFDFLFEFMNRYIKMLYLLNSLEELLEFTAATLFLCAFVMNLFEADGNHFLRLASARIKEYAPPAFVKKCYAGLVLLSFLFFVGMRFVYSAEKEPIVLEAGYRASVFLNWTDGLYQPDGLIYNKELGLIVGNGDEASSVLVFDNDGHGLIYADAGAGLISPEGLGVWQKSLFVADDSQGVVLRYDAAGAPPSVIGQKWLESPDGLAVDTSGNLYIADEKRSLVIKHSGTRWEVLATALDGLQTPEELAFDNEGNLYVTDEKARAVFKISPSGTTTTFVGKSQGLGTPEGIAFHAGKIYVTDNKAGIVYRYDQDGAGGKFLSFAKKYRMLSGIAFDDKNNLYVVSADPYSKSGHILKVELGE